MSSAAFLSAVLRRISLTVVDNRGLTCFSVLPETRCATALSTSVRLCSGGPNEGYKVNSLKENRNPRNLEEKGLARKRQGWVLQSPRKDFYHRVVFEPTNRETLGRVEHFSGKTVVQASATEQAIKASLYSMTDVTAARNVGLVLARRSLECGIIDVFCEVDEEESKSARMEAFIGGLNDGGLGLEEPDQVQPEFKPGVDYSRPHRVGEKKKWKDDYQPL